MHFIRSVYYWASQGCPDATPAGIIAVDVGETFDLKTDLQELGYLLTSAGVFDDTCWQIGCTQENVDLVMKTVPHETLGEVGTTLSNDQLLPTWQWEIIKEHTKVEVSEHGIDDYLDYLDPEQAQLFN